VTAASIPAILRGLLDLPPAGSTIADEVDALHVAVITTTMIGSTAIAAVAAYFILRYRRRSDTQLTQHFVTGTPLELSFAVGTLGLFIAFWLIGYHQYVEIEVPPKDALLVYVQAKQWMWKFTYPDGRSTNDVLVAPAETNVRLVMGSRDVIHSFYVPGFRVKQDIVPGRYVTAWFRSDRPGTYPILCAELCGVGHSMMRGSVVVLAKPDYDAWLGHGEAGATDTPLAELGREAAVQHACVACHTWNGQRHIGPTWSHLYDSRVTLADGRTVVADEAYLTRSMMEPGADIVATFSDVMPASYRYTLSQPDVAAIVAFIRSLENGPSTQDAPLPALGFTALGDAGLPAGPPPGPHLPVPPSERPDQELQ
jgi:cytochrome c oxidase subunit II